MPSAAELNALWLSLQFAALASALGLAPAIAIAHTLSRPALSGRTVFNVRLDAPLVLPPVVIGYRLLMRFGMWRPLEAWLEAAIGIRMVFTTAGAVRAALIMAFPIMVRAIKLALDAGATPCVAHSGFQSSRNWR